MEPQRVERRSEPRYAVSGEVRISEHGGAMASFPGQLVEASATGFRLRHICLTLGSGQLVDFSWPGRSGVARVVWTRIAGSEAETGFHIL